MQSAPFVSMMRQGHILQDFQPLLWVCFPSRPGENRRHLDMSLHLSGRCSTISPSLNAASAKTPRPWSLDLKAQTEGTASIESPWVQKEAESLGVANRWAMSNESNHTISKSCSGGFCVHSCAGPDLFLSQIVSFKMVPTPPRGIRPGVLGHAFQAYTIHLLPLHARKRPNRLCVSLAFRETAPICTKTV